MIYVLVALKRVGIGGMSGTLALIKLTELELGPVPI
jgi:hypothetical protein